MNVYDFDGTIYDGDSSVDFYKFVLKRHPAILRYLPCFCVTMLWHKAGQCSTEDLKSCFFKFLNEIPDVQCEVSLFWQTHMAHIMPWYHQQKQKSDIVISASPAFLLRIPCQQLGIDTLIASDVDMHTGQFQNKNCKGEEKVRRFRRQFPDEPVDKFYSDSVSDLPMARLASEAFLVKHGRIVCWNAMKEAAK